MKQVKVSSQFKTWICFVVLSIFTLISFAQDTTSSSITTTTTRTEETSWYTSPWVWVAGAAVFILLLAAILRGSGSSKSGTSDKVTVTKTVKRDTEA